MKLALVGYGRMGREVERLAVEAGHEVVARIDDGARLGAEALAGAEVAVEFSLPETAPDNLVRLAGMGIPVACGTTGWSGDLPRVRGAVEAAGTGLVWAPNFSLGVALFTRLVRRAAELARAVEEYDMHLHEAHHRHKVDAPSGTAAMLADQVVARLGRKTGWELGPPDGPADPATLYVSVTRAGEIPGSHTLGLEGPDDRIVLTHEARGRSGFARGALRAAEWIRGRTGAYSVDDWLADVFAPEDGSARP